MLQPLMVWIAAVLALLHSARAHDDPPPPRIEGMVALWVEPQAIGVLMAQVHPPERTVSHPVVPSGRALLVRDEGVALDALVDAVSGVPGVLEVTPHPSGSALVVRHPDLLSVLAEPLGDGTVGDAVSIWPMPVVAIPLPTGDSSAPSGTATLQIENPFTARMVVTLEGTAIGELGPRQTARFEHVPAGDYEVTLARRVESRVRRRFTVHAR